jgi:hypothetical protein
LSTAFVRKEFASTSNTLFSFELGELSDFAMSMPQIATRMLLPSRFFRVASVIA